MQEENTVQEHEKSKNSDCKESFKIDDPQKAETKEEILCSDPYRQKGWKEELLFEME